MAMEPRVAQDYINNAREFLEASEREFANGDHRQGAEKLYGSACQVVIAASIRNGWDCDTHRATKNNTQRLANQHNDPFLIDGFTIAETFHRHFFHNSKEDYEINIDRPRVHAYVDRMLELLEVGE